MEHMTVKGKTLPEAYHNALVALHKYGTDVPCPDYETKIKELSLTFYVEDALREPMVSRCFPGGPYELQQYRMEVCDGILDFMIGKGETTWEYTYHDRIAPQIPFVLQELSRNPYSRRAVINVRDFDVDSRTEHPACLQNMAFYVRDGALHQKATMRSNDAVQAAFMNAFAFIMLQKRVADKLVVGVGSYTHTAYSFHAYERNLNTLDRYVKRIVGKKVGTTYPYVGCYDTLMAEAAPSIHNMVENQKSKYLKTWVYSE